MTIDEELLPRAKRFAHQRGVSLSRLIEDALRELSPAEEGAFSERWRGSFEARHADDERYRRLAKKYL